MAKKSFAKRVLSKVLVPATKIYLSHNRNVKFMNMDLHVPTGVFHPSLFFSTKTMCQFLSTIDLHKKKILEIGCGSGAISIFAAKAEGNVFCCDINPLSVQATIQNAKKNTVGISILESDLFSSIAETDFDIILNNPPFYPYNPTNLVERAWYAGRSYEYFKNFFNQVENFIKPDGIIYMVFSSDCNLRKIDNIATGNGFKGKTVYTRTSFMEKTFIIRYCKQLSVKT